MSLVTLDRYRAITGDQTTDDAVVTARIEEAVDMLEEDLGRPLESDERTELMWPDRAGWVFPLAVPITVAEGWTIDGNALRGGAWPLPSWPESRDSIEVTYTGGYVERTANPSESNALPVHIERDLAWAAHALANADSIMAGLAAGANSVAVGDISVSFERGVNASPDDLRIRWSRVTRRHKRRSL